MNQRIGIRKLIGSRQFYKAILVIAVPIMIQNGITNFVSLLDNIMIGRIGTQQMSGASIVNQLIFVYNLCIFGGVSGAGIFTAQYFGQRDLEGVRRTFRFKIWMVLLLTTFAMILFLTNGTPLINLYLKGAGEQGQAEMIRDYGLRYMKVMLIGLPAFMFSQVYASTLRECGETVLPMKAGIISVFVNLVLNYLLIYGKFDLPELGVIGAALATVISRYVEALIIIVNVHRQKEKYPFIQTLYSTMRVPLPLTRKIILKGTPLLLNETCWACGFAVLNQCYCYKGLDVVAALNISSTINNLFNIVFIALGESVAIIVGQQLGADNLSEAKDTAWKMISFSVFCCTCTAIVMLFVAPAFPKLYNTQDQVRSIAKDFIIIQALFMPMNAFLHACYFTLRSGGKTVITFLFDSVYICLISAPVAFVLSRFAPLSVQTVFILVQFVDIAKCIIGYILVRKGIWLQNIVNDL